MSADTSKYLMKYPFVCCLQMIRLTQPELVHDKKEKDSPDDSTAAIKKEADAEPVTSQGADQASSGTLVGFICLLYHKHSAE